MQAIRHPVAVNERHLHRLATSFKADSAIVGWIAAVSQIIDQKARKLPVSDVLRDKRYTCFRWSALPPCAAGRATNLIKIIYRTEHISNATMLAS